MRYPFKIKSIRNSLFLFLLLVIFIVPSFTNAATLFIIPQSNEVKVGDTFNVLINTDSKGAYINASSVDIKFDNSLLSVQSLGYSNSIFSLWAEEPTYSNVNGVVHFSGGLSSPGWNGNNGAILRVTFKAKGVGQTNLTLENGSVLANDGLGTNVLTDVKGSSIKIVKSTPIIKEEKPVEEKTVSTSTATSTAENELDLSLIPVITNIPEQLTEGSILSFDGSGVLSGQIQVYIQKGNDNAEIILINTEKDGKFVVKYKNPVSLGYYKIWARNILPDSRISTSSEISYVEVVAKKTINLNGWEVNYTNLIYTLLAISIFLFVLLVLLIVFIFRLKYKNRRKKTI